MAVTRNLMVRAGANFSGITKEAQRAKSSVASMRRGFEKEFSGMQRAASGLKKALGAVVVAVSIGAIINGAKDARAAFAELEESQAKLAQVMRNTMGATADDVKSINDLVGAQEKLGVISDDVQLSGAQELATYLGEVKSLRALIPVMNDMVAQQYGLNATQEQAVGIATMLGKVMQGQTGGLSRYGYYFDEAQAAILKYGTEEQRVATLSAVVEQSVGGMNAALAATPSGRLKQVENSLDQIKTSFGQAVTTLLTAFLPALNGLISLLDGVAAVANRVAQSIANVFGAKVKTQSVGVSNTIGTAAGAMGDLKTATEGTVAAANKLRTAEFDTLQKLTGGSASSGGGGSSVGDVAEAVGGIGGGWEFSEEASESIGWLEEKLQHLKDTLGKINFTPMKESLGRLKTSFQELGEAISPYFRDIYDNILVPFAKWTIEDLAPQSVDVLRNALELLSTVLDGIHPEFEWFLENWLKPLQEDLQNLITVKLERFGNALKDVNDAFDALFNGKTAKEKMTGFINGIGDAWDEISPVRRMIRQNLGDQDRFHSESLIKWGNYQGEIVRKQQETAQQIQNSMNGLGAGIKASVSSWAAECRAQIASISAATGALYGAGLGGGTRQSISGYVSVPHLADGAVLQPMHPFAAVVGDQRSGVNVESPLSTITEAMIGALDLRGGAGSDDTVEVLERILTEVKRGRNIVVNDRVLGRTARNSINDLSRVTG